MATATGTTELQATARPDGVHLWGIDPDTGEIASSARVLRLVDRHLGRHVTAAAVLSRTGVDLPEPLGHTMVPSLRLGPGHLADLTVLAPPAGPRPADNGDDGTRAEPAAEPSPIGASLRWFADLARLARAVVEAGRIRPVLTVAGPVHQARWHPVTEPALDDAVAALDAMRPPVCGDERIDHLVTTTVDACARRVLGDEAWRPPPPLRARGTEYRAAQATFRALAAGSPSVLYRIEDVPALGELSRAFVRELDRAGGLPVVAPQLRLHLPPDEHGDWAVTLELYDTDRPERWCAGRDVAAVTPLALDLAGTEAHLVRLQDVLVTAGRVLADELPILEPFRVRQDDVIELDLDAVEELLVHAPEVVERHGVRLLGPEQLVRTSAAVRGSAAPRPDTGTGRFTAGAIVDWRATVDDAPIDEAQLERAAQAGSSLVHVHGRWVRLDPTQVRATLDRLQRHRRDHGELEVRELLRLAAEAAAADAAAAATAGLGSVATPFAIAQPFGTPTQLDGVGWVRDLLEGMPDERLLERHEPDSFVGELRHYQRRGLSWMSFLERLGLGGCLADDMGLGKTATTLAHLAERPGPHLVVCPLSVVHNWSAEAARFTPELVVTVHHGGERIRDADALAGALAGQPEIGTLGLDPMVPADIVITTYGTLARDVEALASVRWSTLVLDEAQAVKNHLTNAAKAVRRIPAGQRLALTGTPVENHLGELWAILDAVNPGMLGSARAFDERYGKPIQKHHDEAATAALRALTQPFVLRRTKADKTLLPELPDKIEQIAWATLTREQAAMYQAVVDQLLADAQAEAGMRRRGIVLAALTRLKQICNHPAHALNDGSRLSGRSGKLARFDELVDELLDADERALVFTQFREMGLLLQRHVHERLAERLGPGADVPFLHGGITRMGRQRMVERFQSGEGPPLLLVSLKAGGTGLNLTAASQVIHYDRWWNPAVEDQATDRAWRLGQLRTVLVHKMVCEGTLEERIGQLIDDKRALAGRVLGEGEQWLSELSTDDLHELVALAPTDVPPPSRRGGGG